MEGHEPAAHQLIECAAGEDKSGYQLSDLHQGQELHSLQCNIHCDGGYQHRHCGCTAALPACAAALQQASRGHIHARTHSDRNTKRIYQASVHAQHQRVYAQHPACPAGQDAERPEIQRTPCSEASRAQARAPSSNLHRCALGA